MEILERINSFKLLIWDFEGTIVHMQIDWTSLKNELKKICDRHQVPCSDTFYNHFVYNALTTPDKDKVFPLITSAELAASWHPINSSINLIKQFKGLQVIFSDNMRASITPILNTLGISDKIQMLVTKDDVTRYKPEPEGLATIMRTHTSIGKNEILYIGDSWKDKEIANNAGIEYLHPQDL